MYAIRSYYENFSSQNVNLEVSDIGRGANGEVVSFGFPDGSSFFIHPQIAVEYSIRIGTEISRQLLEEILQQSAVYAARDKAVEYLARREHSSSELVLKLQKKGYDRETARAAVNICLDRGYADDRRFAEAWIESRLKKHPEGRSSLAAGLARKGVPRRIADEILEEMLSGDQERNALLQSLQKYVRTRSADPKKVLNHLLRRGFKYADIKP